MVLRLSSLLQGHCVGLLPSNECSRLLWHMTGISDELTSSAGISFDISARPLLAPPRVEMVDGVVDEFVLSLGAIQRHRDMVECDSLGFSWFRRCKSPGACGQQ
jgi:hypothetical protein